jgi:putative multiple sugar transport system substrate-binding protein
MTVYKDTRILAKDAFNVAQEILEGKRPYTNSSYDNGKTNIRAIQTDVIVVTKDNVQEVLIDSGQFKAKDFKGL